MNYHARIAVALAVAALMLLAPTGISAQTGSGTPVVIPPPPPAPSGPSLGVDAVGYPFDFQFAGHVFGYGFKAGESVTVITEGTSAAPATVTAGADGRFSAALAFTWVFCGAGASAQPPPVVVASGNQGSQAQYKFPAAACPMLVSAEVFGKGAPTGGFRPTVGFPPQDGGGASLLVRQRQRGEPATVRDDQTIPPRLAQFDIQGFGFVPGERVDVRESFGSLSTPAPITTVADGQGRLHFSVPAYVPGHCSSGPVPLLLAGGDQGTAVAAPLAWRDPIMTACPEVPSPTSPVAPASVTPTKPITASLHPSPAHPGSTERLRVRADGASAVDLSVMYADGTTTHRTATVASSGYTTVRWPVPATVSSGAARAELTLEPSHLVLPFAFSVQ